MDLSKITSTLSAAAAAAEYRKLGFFARHPLLTFGVGPLLLTLDPPANPGQAFGATLTTTGVKIEASEFLSETKVQNATIQVRMP